MDQGRFLNWTGIKDFVLTGNKDTFALSVALVFVKRTNLGSSLN